MIHYDLCCQRDHGFDGWFRNASAFEAEKMAGRLQCPVCGSSNVAKRLMTPALRSGRRSHVDDAAPPSNGVTARRGVDPSRNRMHPGDSADSGHAPQQALSHASRMGPSARIDPNDRRDGEADQSVGDNAGSVPQQGRLPASVTSGLNGLLPEKVARELRQFVENNFRDVGDRFADEARKIHYNEPGKSRGTPEIYGRTTFEEAVELSEEGIHIFPLPILPEEQN